MSDTALDLLRFAAELPDQPGVYFTATLDVNRPGQTPSGYMAGQPLIDAMARFYTEILGPLNLERVRRLSALIADRAAVPTVNQIVPCIIEPLEAALSGPTALSVHFCYQMLARRVSDIPKAVWWTLALGKTLEPTGDTQIRWRCSALNNALTHLVSSGIRRAFLPLHSESLHNFRTQAYMMAHGMLFSVPGQHAGQQP